MDVDVDVDVDGEGEADADADGKGEGGEQDNVDKTQTKRQRQTDTATTGGSIDGERDDAIGHGRCCHRRVDGWAFFVKFSERASGSDERLSWLFLFLDMKLCSSAAPLLVEAAARVGRSQTLQSLSLALSVPLCCTKHRECSSGWLFGLGTQRQYSQSRRDGTPAEGSIGPLYWLVISNVPSASRFTTPIYIK